jgi:hypothetical protein
MAFVQLLRHARRVVPEPCLGEFCDHVRPYARGTTAAVNHRSAYSVSMRCIFLLSANAVVAAAAIVTPAVITATVATPAAGHGRRYRGDDAAQHLRMEP